MNEKTSGSPAEAPKKGSRYYFQGSDTIYEFDGNTWTKRAPTPQDRVDIEARLQEISKKAGS